MAHFEQFLSDLLILPCHQKTIKSYWADSSQDRPELSLLAAAHCMRAVLVYFRVVVAASVVHSASVYGSAENVHGTRLPSAVLQWY